MEAKGQVRDKTVFHRAVEWIEQSDGSEGVIDAFIAGFNSGLGSASLHAIRQSAQMELSARESKLIEFHNAYVTAVAQVVGEETALKISERAATIRNVPEHWDDEN